MRNLVFFADGTWNDKDNRARLTNVNLLWQLCKKADASEADQKIEYQSGIGTKGNIFSRLSGGAFGKGLDQNIIDAYIWLAENYRPSDRIMLFAFSRGAYTIRSLVGMINAAGLLDLSAEDLNENDRRELSLVAFSRYRERGLDQSKTADVPIHPTPNIQFLGCWDTVGALGIPDEVNIIRKWFNPEKYRFNDTMLSDNVLVARHALSIDEMRRSYAPTLWDETQNNTNRDMKQVWFPGVHANVGGGYSIRDLSDITLEWMIDEAKAVGLLLDPSYKDTLDPRPLGQLENSRKGFFGKLKSRPRSIPNLQRAALNKKVSEAARVRHAANQGYWPTTHLAPGNDILLEVTSKQQWVKTNLFVEDGETYQFTAEGLWFDAKMAHGPIGTPQDRRQKGHKVGDWWSKLEQKWAGNPPEPSTYSPARRFKDANWFSLIGVIANGIGVDQAKKEINEHETFLIGDENTRDIKSGGYLYCYANDAWRFYFNNKGSVTLRAKRLS